MHTPRDSVHKPPITAHTSTLIYHQVLTNRQVLKICDKQSGIYIHVHVYTTYVHYVRLL